MCRRYRLRQVSPFRRDLTDLLARDPATFADRVGEVLETFDLRDEPRERALATGPDGWDGPAALDGYGRLDPTERELVWRAWLFDEAPLGVTLAGAAYRDTPIVYATRTARELTGYDMAALRGENLRLLQGPDTDPEAVADLREALSTWQPVTVELRNYRRDGTPFRNRVSLVPVADEAGTVTNWFGIQAAVEDAPDGCG